MRRVGLSVFVLLVVCISVLSACGESDARQADAWSIAERGVDPGSINAVADAHLSGSLNQSGAPSERAEVRIQLIDPNVCVGVDLRGWSSAPSCPDVDSGDVQVTSCWRLDQAFYSAESCGDASSIPEDTRIIAEQASGEIDLRLERGAVRAVDYLYLDLRFAGEHERLVVELSGLDR